MSQPEHIRHSSLESIQQISLISISDVYFRSVSTKHRDEILSSQGSFEYGGRYNPQGEFGALYLSESENLCKAEINKKAGEPSLVTQVMGKIKVSLTKVLDLTDEQNLKKLGIKKEDLMVEKNQDGWELTWYLARLAY